MRLYEAKNGWVLNGVRPTQFTKLQSRLFELGCVFTTKGSNWIQFTASSNAITTIQRGLGYEAGDGTKDES